MAYIVHEIPYLDTRDINLDWLFKHMRKLEERQDELEEMINNIDSECLVKVEDYGAKGDGETDDTEAIQKCIDENPNSTIFFRKGTYNIRDTIYLYTEVGGQQIVLGGAIINWTGIYDDSKPMFSVTKVMEDDGSGRDYSSPCRILGGNFNGNKRVGYGIEMYSYYGIVDGVKIKGFNKGGLFVGKIAGYEPGEQAKSLQAKLNNMLIYQTEGNYSAEDTSAVIINAPDSEYSQIVTNRTQVGFELRAGGNSFVNCHSTIQFYDTNTVTPEQYNKTKNIWINPASSGSTQQNNFLGCYFNMGKYVVYSEIASRYCVNLDSCFYIWYTADQDHFPLLWRNQADPADPDYPVPDIPDSSHDVGLFIPVYICGGRASDFRCNNIDILVGGKACVMDYFPASAPTIVPLPDMVRINSNDRHPEAPIYSAWNLQPENTLTPLCSTSNPVDLNTFYEVGAILLCYGGTATTMPFTSPVKVRAYEGAGVAEWTIGFESDGLTPPRLHPVILDWHCSTDFTAMLFFIEPDPEDVEIDGLIYPMYKIYLEKTAYGSQPVFCTIENDSPFVKCYVRNQANAARVRADGTGLTALTNTVNPSDIGFWVRGTGNGSIMTPSATSAGGLNSVAIGTNTSANAASSFASGQGTTAPGGVSAAFNNANTARNRYAAVFGSNNYASGQSNFVFGEFSADLDYGTPVNTRGNYIEMVGNGSSSSNRSNARTLDWNGNEKIQGDLTIGTGTINERTLNSTPTSQSITANANISNITGVANELLGIVFVNLRVIVNANIPANAAVISVANNIAQRCILIMTDTDTHLSYCLENISSTDFKAAIPSGQDIPPGIYRITGYYIK